MNNIGLDYIQRNKFYCNRTNKGRMQEPVVRSKTRRSIVYAVTSHVKFQNPKIEKKNSKTIIFWEKK